MIKMSGSITSAFGEPEDFEAALRLEGCVGLLITGRGDFRAQLTQVTLHRLRLLATAEEQHIGGVERGVFNYFSLRHPLASSTTAVDLRHGTADGRAPAEKFVGARP
jgi:hypothetical protein